MFCVLCSIETEDDDYYGIWWFMIRCAFFVFSTGSWISDWYQVVIHPDSCFLKQYTHIPTDPNTFWEGTANLVNQTQQTPLGLCNFQWLMIFTANTVSNRPASSTFQGRQDYCGRATWQKISSLSMAGHGFQFPKMVVVCLSRAGWMVDVLIVAMASWRSIGGIG